MSLRTSPLFETVHHTDQDQQIGAKCTSDMDALGAPYNASPAGRKTDTGASSGKLIKVWKRWDCIYVLLFWSRGLVTGVP